MKSKKIKAKGAATGLQAVILAGGKGTRLKPFTVTMPKPLVPVGDQSIIEVLLLRLAKFGITDVTLTLGHMAEMIRAYFEQRTDLRAKINLNFVQEATPTGTAGSLSLLPTPSETFIVMNGDVLTDLDFHDLIRFHKKNKAMLTIGTHIRRFKVDFGTLDLDSSNRVRQYNEKPAHDYKVSMGIYVYEPEVLTYIKPGAYLDLPSLVQKLIKAKERVCAYQTDCFWLDIGRPDDYAQAQELIAKGK